MWCHVVLVVMLVTARLAIAGPAPIHVGYDIDHLDLDHRVLQFKPSRAIAEATLVVIGEDGQEIGRGSATYDHPPAGAWWSISWSPPDTREIRAMVLKLRVAAADGVATNVELIPWSVSIQHEDVVFRTDSAVIDPDQRARLDASLVRIAEVARVAGKFMPLTLYIAGHTDTVGPAAKNRKLSIDRATAIGRYFRDKHIAMPIIVAGFGEDVLKVATPDETDEPANRRADYVLGPAGGAPPFRGPYLKAHASWQRLR
jgi:outer membrane protein OmpA-like peptidoglycan-associated protein